MSANADSVRFKLACNFHAWAYFENISNCFWQNLMFYKKGLYMVLGKTISCIKFLLVSDFDDGKEADILNRSGLSLNLG